MISCINNHEFPSAILLGSPRFLNIRKSPSLQASITIINHHYHLPSLTSHLSWTIQRHFPSKNTYQPSINHHLTMKATSINHWQSLFNHLLINSHQIPPKKRTNLPSSWHFQPSTVAVSPHTAMAPPWHLGHLRWPSFGQRGQGQRQRRRPSFAGEGARDVGDRHVLVHEPMVNYRGPETSSNNHHHLFSRGE